MTEIPTGKALAVAASLEAENGNVLANRLKSLTKPGDKIDEKGVDKAAGGFEALLLHQMLKSMWETVDTSGLLGEDSNQAQIYRDMFNQSLADSIAEGRGIGVKQFLKGELVRRGIASKG